MFACTFRSRSANIDSTFLGTAVDPHCVVQLDSFLKIGDSAAMVALRAVGDAAAGIAIDDDVCACAKSEIGIGLLSAVSSILRTRRRYSFASQDNGPQ